MWSVKLVVMDLCDFVGWVRLIIAECWIYKVLFSSK